METTTDNKPKGLIYGLEDRPPLRATLFAALQHLLAVFVAIITPPLIIAGALKLDLETTGFLVSMALFVSGVATFIQCRRVVLWVADCSASRARAFPSSAPSSRLVWLGACPPSLEPPSLDL